MPRKRYEAPKCFEFPNVEGRSRKVAALEALLNRSDEELNTHYEQAEIIAPEFSILPVSHRWNASKLKEGIDRGQNRIGRLRKVRNIAGGIALATAVFIGVASEVTDIPLPTSLELPVSLAEGMVISFALSRAHSIHDQKQTINGYQRTAAEIYEANNLALPIWARADAVDVESNF